MINAHYKMNLANLLVLELGIRSGFTWTKLGRWERNETAQNDQNREIRSFFIQNNANLSEINITPNERRIKSPWHSSELITWYFDQ